MNFQGCEGLVDEIWRGFNGQSERKIGRMSSRQAACTYKNESTIVL